MITLSDIESARKRIGEVLHVTPLREGFDIVGNSANLFLKLETFHRTGSFKERGAVNKLYSLSKGEVRGVIAASAGNHAQAVAYHGSLLGLSVTIVMPEQTALNKINATRRWGADVKLVGANFDEAMDHAKTLASEKKLTFVHAFDDEKIIAGQGTVGLELLEQLPEIDTVVIPVGGGGLASGTAIALKERNSKIRVVAVQTELYPFMLRAWKKETSPNAAQPSIPTIADGIAIKRAGEITTPILQKYLDDFVTVTEEEIANAILHLLESSKLLVEGAGAAGVAALMAGKVKKIKGNTVALLCGGNIDVNLIARIIEKGLIKSGRLARIQVVVPDRPGGLQGLTKVLAEAKANILQIQHDRANTHISLATTGTDLTLETRGPDHIDEILKRLKESGYVVNRHD